MAAHKDRTVHFFVLTFLFTWGLQIPAVIARAADPSNAAAYEGLAALGIFGPCVSALCLTRLDAGGQGVRSLLRSVLAWRASPRFYVLALAPAVLLTVGLLVLNLAGRTGPVLYFPGIGGVVLGIVISVEEEIGWRGFALPRLIARFGRFGASVLLGAIWYVWHLPMFVGQGIPLDLILVMLLFFSGASLLLTAIYEGTGGSLLLVGLGHLAAHINNSHRALPGDATPIVAHAILFAGLGLLAMRMSLGSGHLTSAARTSSTS